jgi:beta-phosphoglucomutase-like phosphatase (HAD superfamily)
MIDKIYLDMDGVICNFHKRYQELFNTAPEHDDSRKRFGQRFGIFIQNNNFATLDMMPDALELLSYLKTVNVPIEILSSTAREVTNEEISRQKQIWLDNHDIKYPAIFVPGKRLKVNYASENCILIDDTVSNIDDWNAKGGIGILHKNASDTISALQPLLLT